jgi:GDPmannose 4,6-dehydratase
LSGTVSLIHALLNAAPEAHLVAAASSQIFTAEEPNTYVDENSPIRPPTFYGLTKASTMSVINYYRQKGKLRGGSAILFNHESEYRPASFVTRTISLAVAAIAGGRQKRLSLANIGAAADWCAAEDAVQAMLMMAGMGLNEDLIISSGKVTFLKGLLDAAFETVGLDWHDYVDGDKDEIRPFLVGNPNRIERICGWKVTTPMSRVMEAMVKHDQALLTQVPSHLEPQ